MLETASTELENNLFPPQFVFVSLRARTSLLQRSRGSRNPQSSSFCLLSSPSWPPFPRAPGSVSPIPQITGTRRGVLGVLCSVLPACWGASESQAGLAALMRNPQAICRGCMHLCFGVYSQVLSIRKMETRGQSCCVPNRWLRTEHLSLAAAFVVCVLADTFCPCLLPQHVLVLVQNAKERCTGGEGRCVEVCSLCSPHHPGGWDLKGVGGSHC